MTVIFPSLPQRDNSSERKRALETARETYRYNYDYIPSLAMNEEVPLLENPDVVWFVKVIDILFQRERNAIEVKNNTDLEVPGTNLEAALQEIYESVGVKPAGEILTALLELLAISRPVGRPRDLKDYELLFQSSEIPADYDKYLDDDHFAEMRVAGANPLVIKQVHRLPGHFPITEDIFRATADFADDTLAEAGAEGRLYLADYALFSTMDPGALPTQPKFVYAPMALFARPRNGEKLKPVAIQCNQDPGTNPIFTPNDGWTWQIAKAIVQVADTNHHELISHLGTTHLVLEAIAMSTNRQLSYRHPLYLLLKPHFQGTFFINNLATKILLPEGKPVPVLLTGDTASLHQQAIAAVQNFSFRDAYLPLDLKNRGVDKVDKLPYYPYRDDALKIWYAIRDWVSEYVSIYYNSDKDVRKDTEVQAWAAEIGSENGGRLRGFGDGGGSIHSLESLIDTLTMIIFTASAQHAAVNFPQKTEMSFTPLYPLAGYLPAPTDTRHTADDFLNMFSPLDNAMEQQEVLMLLGSVYHTQLGQYGLHFLDLRVAGPLYRFQKTLREIEGEIALRNESLERPYETLLPSKIPQSTNI